MKALWLTLAYLSCALGFAWLALAMEVHWRQVHGDAPPSRARVLALRWLGGLGVFVSLLLCLLADHPSMAALVWLMTLAAAALTVAFVLSWRPRLLMPLAAWARAGARPSARR